MPASTKKAEIEKMAQKLSGRKIHFTITAFSGKEAEKNTQTSAAKISVAKADIKVPVISAEEPFIKADFSAEALAAMPAIAKAKAAKAQEALSKPLATQAVPEEVQGLLDIFGGEVLV